MPDLVVFLTLCIALSVFVAVPMAVRGRDR